MATPVEQLHEVGLLVMCLHCLLVGNTQQFHKIITIPVELQLYQLNEFMYTFLQCSMLSVHHKVQINTSFLADDVHSVLILVGQSLSL